jgi:GntR family transcriptional regulator
MVAFNLPVSRFTKTAPLYIQIAEEILDRIESGELSPGDRLPSERQLSRVLGVNRMTLRRGLEVLESQGLILRRRGDGTYVAEPKIEWQVGRLIPFAPGMRGRDFVSGGKVISLEERPVEVAVANELGLPVSAPVFYLHRLRLINREPAISEELTIPAQRFPGFEQLDLSSRSVYDVFKAEYGIAVVRARQSLEPVVATEHEADLLAVPPGFPLMLERRLGFDQDNLPVEFGKNLYRGDRFRFVTEIGRPEA